VQLGSRLDMAGLSSATGGRAFVEQVARGGAELPPLLDALVRQRAGSRIAGEVDNPCDARQRQVQRHAVDSDHGGSSGLG